ncbi:hypothetical protein M5X17_27955 [Paenibacillus alvei]|uniref:hypothetical protein n=1 Tax=Paenibacillus alvei TaxID=44250 RepID=UPI00228122BC|nr:hypothetical protein [Paenibacillus alvei]MCY9737542.1 hypothetical protein [Paenibacillus alvei]
MKDNEINFKKKIEQLLIVGSFGAALKDAGIMTKDFIKDNPIVDKVYSIAGDMIEEYPEETSDENIVSILTSIFLKEAEALCDMFNESVDGSDENVQDKE